MKNVPFRNMLIPFLLIKLWKSVKKNFVPFVVVICAIVIIAALASMVNNIGENNSDALNNVLVLFVCVAIIYFLRNKLKKAVSSWEDNSVKM